MSEKILADPNKVLRDAQDAFAAVQAMREVQDRTEKMVREFYERTVDNPEDNY